MILNTSLNTKGKPIAATPEDCVECFFESNLDAIFIGNYLVQRE